MNYRVTFEYDGFRESEIVRGCWDAREAIEVIANRYPGCMIINTKRIR